MANQTKKCAHPTRNCIASNHSKYCSQYCEDARGTMESSCNCGHAGCGVSESQPLSAKG